MRKGILALFIAVSFILGSCASTTPKSGVIQVATEAAYPPFEKLGINGKIDGFDVRLIEAVAKASNLKIKVNNTAWENIFEGIRSGKYDVAVSAITITKERTSVCEFSKPYLDAKQLILVPISSTVKSLKDLAGKNIGVQSGTTGQIAVQKQFGKTNDKIKGYDDTMSAISDLLSGRLDAVVADSGLVQSYIKTQGKAGFKLVDDPSFQKEQYGFCVKKDDQDLLNKLNAGLEKVKKDGTYKKLYEEYFAG